LAVLRASVVKVLGFPITRDVGDHRGPQIGPLLPGWGGMTRDHGDLPPPTPFFSTFVANKALVPFDPRVTQA